VIDLDEFVDPMGAGMTLQNGLAPMAGQCARELRFGEQALQVPLHLRAVAGDQIILAGAETMFAVFPQRANQRNAAGQRFKRTDCRNAGQSPDVGPARNVNRESKAREYGGRLEIGQSAAVIDTGG